MAENEKREPHPTRKNISINQEDGLLYKRVNNHLEMIHQKMTELQELEDFRRATGVVSMTSRSRVRVAPPADQTPDESNT